MGAPTCGRRRWPVGWRRRTASTLVRSKGSGPGEKVTKEDVLAAGNGGGTGAGSGR